MGGLCILDGNSVANCIEACLELVRSRLLCQMVVCLLFITIGSCNANITNSCMANMDRKRAALPVIAHELLKNSSTVMMICLLGELVGEIVTSRWYSVRCTARRQGAKPHLRGVFPLRTSKLANAPNLRENPRIHNYSSPIPPTASILTLDRQDEAQHLLPGQRVPEIDRDRR